MGGTPGEGGDLAMSMKNDVSPPNPDDDLDDDEAAEVEPEGSKALRECYGHMQSAKSVLDKHAARVEHPKVQKCLQKAAEEVGGTLSDLAKCHKAEYAEQGQDALDTEEHDEPIESKSALRRLRYHKDRGEAFRIKLQARINGYIKRAADDPELKKVFVDLLKFSQHEMGTIVRGLEDVCTDAQYTVKASPDELNKKLAAEIAELTKKMTETAAKVQAAIPTNRI
jgi:hypothetical protein